uniref:Ig-like domain-containing protein n=1 Tax=Monopterus albus TaxID=43700 RepID=A0A3Q3K104_MONAL
MNNLASNKITLYSFHILRLLTCSSVNMQSNTLTPVIIVQLGEPITFTCVLPKTAVSHTKAHWYKQHDGYILKLIVISQKSTYPKYRPEFPESRLKVNDDGSLSKLTTERTIQEDERMYCYVFMELIMDPRKSDYTVVQWPTVSDPVRPGDSVTLQCSVVSGSENTTCPGGHSVYWFRAGSDKSHPDIIYTDGHNNCEKRPDSVKSCVYRFSKNISSSDAGTYYCAVAACGQILFGSGTKLEIEGMILLSINNVFMHNCLFAAQTEDEDKLNYAAICFSERKVTRGRKKRDFSEDRVYAGVKC